MDNKDWMFIAMRPVHALILLQLIHLKITTGKKARGLMVSEMLIINHILEQACRASDDTSLDA